jgi:hypothetical protein
MKAPKVIPFRQSKMTADVTKATMVESGDIGDLQYEVYQRNNSFAVVHIFDKKRLSVFKKDAAIFEDELAKLKFNEMNEGDTIVMKGSGDNDDLVFKFENGELLISLKRRGFDVLEKLKSVLKRKGKVPSK